MTIVKFKEKEYYRLVSIILIVDCCAVCKYIEINQPDAFLNCKKYNSEYDNKWTMSVSLNGICNKFERSEEKDIDL